MGRLDFPQAARVDCKFTFIPFKQGQLLVFEGKVAHGSKKSGVLAGTNLENDLSRNELEQILLDVLQPKGETLNSGDMRQVVEQAMRDMLISIASYDAESATQREANRGELILSVVPSALNLMPGAVDTIIRHFCTSMKILCEDDFRHHYAFLGSFALQCLLRYTFSFAKPALTWELDSPFENR